MAIFVNTITNNTNIMKKPLDFLTKAIAALLICCGLSISAIAQNRSVSGTVTDSQNVPVIGASVMVVTDSTPPHRYCNRP